MKNLIIVVIVLTFISNSSFGQNMWHRGNINHGNMSMMYNLSTDSVKQIVLTDNNTILYPAAVEYLYYVKSESEFLLAHLNSEVDTSLLENENAVYWYRVYTNIFFRGLLGDDSAIGKMKLIARYASYNPRILAIRTLTQIGVYDNYSFIRTGYNDSPTLFFNLLSWYGNDSRYREEVRSIIMGKLLASTTTSEVIELCWSLNNFSNEGTMILQNYFENKTGVDRYEYFLELGKIGKDDQPERSIYALQYETNDSLRVKYLPNPYEVLTYGIQSNRYLEPKFINFLKTLSITDSNSSLYQLRTHFLLIYTPAKPDSTTPTNNLLDNLYNYVDSVSAYTWLGDLTFSNELKNILTTAKTNLQNGDSLACRVQVKAFQELVDNVYKDSLNTDARFVTIEGWKFLYWNAQYILDRLPEPPANPNLIVNLKNSLGNQIAASNVKYYEGSWKDAVNNGDGTFTVITTKPTVSIRVFYEYASQQVDNVPAQNNTYTFTTVNAAVQLKNSLGSLIDAGTVQYYAGAWRTFGTTSNGVANKELLPVNYSFRMTYEYVSKDKQQNLSTNPVVDFNTVLCSVKVSKTSNNQPINNAAVKYYAGAWRNLGTTNSSGIATKELLPSNISFRATYGSVSQDKQQDISVNSLVEILLNVP